MRIEALTPEQESRLGEYRDKWVRIGLATGAADRPAVEAGIREAYRAGGLAPPQVILWLRSPLAGAVAAIMIAQVRSQVGAQVGAQVKNFIWPYVSGNLWSGWFSFYDFMFSAVIKLETPLFTDLKEMSKLHLVYPLDQACVLSQKPIEINMTNGLLHKDGAPSIKYADGFSVWSLNGVRVPQELAETPTEKLSMEFFKKETNADIRAEFIRKFGIQRMVSLGRVVDSVTEESGEWERRSEYQLIDMGKVYEIPYAPHLKMKNLTTGIYHMEGVDPTCKTVQDAIKYRCGGKKVMIAGIK